MIKTACGNCGLPEAVRPKVPQAGECDCLELTEAGLKEIRTRGLIKRTQAHLGLLDELSLYQILRLDMAHSPKLRDALSTLARFAQSALTRSGKDAEGWELVCDDCDGTGVVEGLAAACDCEAGEGLYD